MRGLRRLLVIAAQGTFIALIWTTHASAEITVEESNYSSGVLTIRGETSQPNQRVTLDGRYAEWTNRYGGFTFRVRYLPGDCLAQIKAGQEERPTYIANCEPSLPKLGGQSRDDQPGDNNGSTSAHAGGTAELRVVTQPCERGGECMVVCRNGEYAISAYCPRGSADILDERSVACRQDTPSRIVAYCVSPGSS
jgi:hypothetical protein